MKFCTPHIWLMKRGIFPILSRCYVWRIDLENGINIRVALCHFEIFRYIIQVLDINFSGWLKYHSYLLKYFPYLSLSYNARKRSFTLTKNKITLIIYDYIYENFVHPEGCFIQFFDPYLYRIRLENKINLWRSLMLC